jgi:histidine triad (HIT) family protein
VIPKKHYTNIFDMPTSQLLQVIAALKHVIDLYHDKLGIENLQNVNSSGAEAQQEVFHLHFHIVPRHKGDQQDVRWSPHPEMRGRFEQLLSQLQ